MSKQHPESDQYYQHLGFKCGLEIHQQLRTEKKLFCRCKAVLHTDPPTATIVRHMRPTLSEMGNYDGTALMEFKTKKNVTYQLYDDTVCTYEMDDTPPFRLNTDALDIALEVALLLNCSIVDEIHISRKQYLDGSIPTGFQRTGIIGVEGSIPYKNKTIRIIQLGLEEDACREIQDKQHTIVFRTDRLSIPLVEVVTYPDMTTPAEVEEVASLIGRLLRSTGKVRRGLGSIRQDVNVSITGSTRVELKGVPKLQYLAKAVAVEAKRHKALLDIREQLQNRGITAENFQSDACEVTALFNKTRCTRFKEVLKIKQHIYAVVLRNFGTVLDTPTQPGKMFGDEFAGRVRVIACLDTMPNIVYTNHFEDFGLTKKEITKLEHHLQATPKDCVVLVWGTDADVTTAIEEIKIRAVDALSGVPSETRQVFSDGTNDFERILPGPDRMYPDTDSPPTPIREDDLSRIRQSLPEPLWSCEERLARLGLSPSVVSSLCISPRLYVFNRIVSDFAISPVLVAVTLQERLKWLQRQGKNVEQLSDETIYQVFQALQEHRISKEAVPPLLRLLTDHPNMAVSQAIDNLQITQFTTADLERIIQEAIATYQTTKTLDHCIHGIMGVVMRQVRNQVDGQRVYDMVRQKISTSSGL
ncbi:MAG: Glu-tRNA(Gln) amidotransferase subunit GatE [Candidatus Thermoplasmatota archaeon]|nr:Glu-tRNA(Gln) amidotransferase subunit GatE [Candidatus Thermoplasmatota archaeon]